METRDDHGGLRAGLLLILTLASHAAHAQAVDCQRLLKTSVPYEMQMTQERFFPAKSSQTVPSLRQVYRNSGNLSIAYIQQFSSIFRAINYGPFITELMLDGKRVLATTEYSGIDIRSPPPFDTNYSYTRIAIAENGAREQFAVNVRYRGNKTIKLGGCDIPLVTSYAESRAADGTLRSTAEIDYSPDLRDILYSSAMDAKAGVVMVTTAKDIRTAFTPLEQK